MDRCRDDVVRVGRRIVTYSQKYQFIISRNSVLGHFSQHIHDPIRSGNSNVFEVDEPGNLQSHHYDVTTRIGTVLGLPHTTVRGR